MEEYTRYSTQHEADNEEAHNVGMDNPEREWILTNRDVWHRNPFYTGKPTRHPEERDVELSQEEVSQMESDYERWKRTGDPRI